MRSHGFKSSNVEQRHPYWRTAFWTCFYYERLSDIYLFSQARITATILTWIQHQYSASRYRITLWMSTRVALILGTKKPYSCDVSTSARTKFAEFNQKYTHRSTSINTHSSTEDNETPLTFNATGLEQLIRKAFIVRNDHETFRPLRPIISCFNIKSSHTYVNKYWLFEIIAFL